MYPKVFSLVFFLFLKKPYELKHLIENSLYKTDPPTFILYRKSLLIAWAK